MAHRFAWLPVLAVALVAVGCGSDARSGAESVAGKRVGTTMIASVGGGDGAMRGHGSSTRDGDRDAPARPSDADDGAGDKGATTEGDGDSAGAPDGLSKDGEGDDGDDAQAQGREGARQVGPTIVVGESEFGPMLFDGERQAIYVFELDRRNATVCYDECARAWPPVYADGAPVAGEGVDPDALGTIDRGDGRLQVTYAGRPLYYYANERPGEIRCHNVTLNGGKWWVVGVDGEPLP